MNLDLRPKVTFRVASFVIDHYLKDNASNRSIDMLAFEQLVDKYYQGYIKDVNFTINEIVDGPKKYQIVYTFKIRDHI
jgi:hypothetical protein